MSSQGKNDLHSVAEIKMNSLGFCVLFAFLFDKYNSVKKPVE